MNNQSILITCGTGPLAQRIKQNLSAFDVYLATSQPVPDVLLSSGKYFRIPSALTPHFIHELLKISLDLQVDYLLPLGVKEIQTLVEGKLLFEEYGISLLVPEATLAEDIPHLVDPPRGVPLEIIHKGRSVHSAYFVPDSNYSGLFTFNDDDEPYLCFSTD